MPALWYEFDRALYIGERTRWTAAITSLPTDPPVEAIAVDRCEIHGCTLGLSTSYCDGGDGEHFCESQDIDEAPRELQCLGEIAEY